MKNSNKLSYFLITLSLLFTLSATVVGCKHNLIPEPSNNGNGTKNPADYDDYILPPKNVVASHGDSRKVTITWDPLPNAVNYFIYSANTPFDDFVKIGEEKGTSFISDREDFGVSKYYAVSAINYYGTESFMSDKAHGSTLGKPFITSIDADESGNSVTVHWWMENCSKDTYQDFIEYNVSIFQDANKTPVAGVDPITVPATDEEGNASTSATFEGLLPNTDYYFIVEVINTNDPQIKESSDLTNQATAHQLLPSIPEDFAVEQGVNSEAVILTWSLPNNVDYYDSKSMIYEEHPVYFRLLRKNLGEDDSKYTAIADYIGVNAGKTGAKQFYFDCSNNTTSNSDVLTVEKDAASDDKTNALYNTYTPNSKITFKDTNIERGKQYTYSLFAYTDYATKLYESEKAEMDGWPIAVPDFKVSTNFTLDESNENIIKTITVSYNFDFDAFEKDYTYVITTSRTDFTPEATAGAPYVVSSFNSIEQLNSFTNTIDCSLTEKHGYYNFQLYIIDHSEEAVTAVPAEAYEVAIANGRATVTNDAKLIPNIQNFAIEDGYKDKFVITWDDSKVGNNCTYTLNYIPYVNGVPGKEVSEELDNSLFERSENTLKYEHLAVSGDCRKYSLTASTGLSATKSLDQIYETLGTPVPVKGQSDYKTITVTWNPVQMAAETYTVSAVYQNGSTELVSAENTTIELVDGKYKCIITEPEGYNDATVSGKPIDFIVTAKSSKTTDSTANEPLEVKTMGPALVNITPAKVISNDHIQISWNKIEDAKGYIINRVLYNDNATTTGNTSTYYFDAETNTISDASGQSVAGRATVLANLGTYTLTDVQKDMDADETSGYQSYQEKIQWGVPFGYVILPVYDSTFITDSKYDAPFKFESDSQTLEAGVSEVDYSNLRKTEKITATNGYGLNVKASKSEYANKVHLKWDTPYIEGSSPVIYRRLYKYDSLGKVTSANSNWELVKTEGSLPSETTEYDVIFDNSEWGNAYDFAIQYTTDNPDFVKPYVNDLSSYGKRETRYTYPDKQIYDVSQDKNVQIWEPASKGYVLALENFKAEYGGTDTTSENDAYYMESVTWKNWDEEIRVLGPDQYSFELLNKNLSSTKDWVPLVESLDKTSAGATRTETEEVDTEYTITNTDTNTIVTKKASVNQITLKPVFDSNTNTTSGYLKVLRDAKHYYSVKLKRTDEKLSETVIVRQAEDFSIYGYRQITNEEFTKAVMITIADAFNGTDNTKSEIALEDWMYGKRYSHTTDSAINSGSFKFTENKGNISLNATNYIHEFTSTPTDLHIVSCFKINASITNGGRWDNNSSTYHFRYIATEQKDPSSSNMVRFTILNSYDNINLESYKGKVYFSSSDSTLYLKTTRTVDGTEKTVVDKTSGLKKQSTHSYDDLRYWNPMKIAANDYLGTNETYNWWN